MKWNEKQINFLTARVSSFYSIPKVCNSSNPSLSTKRSYSLKKEKKFLRGILNQQYLVALPADCTITKKSMDNNRNSHLPNFESTFILILFWIINPFHREESACTVNPSPVPSSTGRKDGGEAHTGHSLFLTLELLGWQASLQVTHYCWEFHLRGWTKWQSAS